MQQYAVWFILLQSHSTCFGCHRTHHQWFVFILYYSNHINIISRNFLSYIYCSLHICFLVFTKIGKIYNVARTVRNVLLVTKYFLQSVTCARECAAGGRGVLWTRREVRIRILKGLIVWMLKFITKLVMWSGWIFNTGEDSNIWRTWKLTWQVGIKWKPGWFADMIWGLAKGIPSLQQISVRHSGFFLMTVPEILKRFVFTNKISISMKGSSYVALEPGSSVLCMSAFFHMMSCPYILSLTLINTRWRSDIAWCTSFLHCRQEELITTHTPAPFYCPCPDATFFCNWTSFRKLSRIFFHLRWTSLPGSKKRSTKVWFCYYLQVPCKWQQFSFIASWIPAWSHNYSRNCRGHTRSNMGRSASSVCHRKARTNGYD